MTTLNTSETSLYNFYDSLRYFKTEEEKFAIVIKSLKQFRGIFINKSTNSFLPLFPFDIELGSRFVFEKEGGERKTLSKNKH